MICIGIDPGLKGAIGALVDGYPSVYDMPVLNSHIQVRAFVGIIDDIRAGWGRDKEIMVYIEKQQAMPGQGLSSTFKNGANYGSLLTALTLLNVAFDDIPPQTWKKAMGLTKEKELSREKALQLFPLCAHDLQRKKDEGRAEALLLAEYCRRKMAAFGMQVAPQEQEIGL